MGDQGLESGGRRLVVHAVILTVLAGSAACITFDSEIWPFSNYPMFSERRSHRFERTVLFAVSAGGERRFDPGRWLPLDMVRLQFGLAKMETLPDRQSRLAAALRYVRDRHDAAVRAGEIDEAPLEKLRLYRVAFTLEPGARNRHALPRERRLVAEWVVPAREEP